MTHRKRFLIALAGLIFLLSACEDNDRSTDVGYSVSVSKSGEGHVFGQLLKDNGPSEGGGEYIVINCGYLCNWSMNPVEATINEDVTGFSLKAIPSFGWQFAYWSGHCLGMTGPNIEISFWETRISDCTANLSSTTPVATPTLEQSGLVGTVSFCDGTFSFSDWEIFEEFAAGGGTHSYPQGTYEFIEFTLPITGSGDPSSINVRYRYLNGGYDPSADGAIDHINLSMDRVIFPKSPSAVGHGFVLVQDDIPYFTDLGNFTNTEWETVTLTNLGTSDFSTANGASNPDFSASGSAMSFGFLRSNTNSGQGAIIETAHAIDNWCVTIEPIQP